MEAKEAKAIPKNGKQTKTNGERNVIIFEWLRRFKYFSFLKIVQDMLGMPSHFHYRYLAEGSCGIRFTVKNCLKPRPSQGTCFPSNGVWVKRQMWPGITCSVSPVMMVLSLTLLLEERAR